MRHCALGLHVGSMRSSMTAVAAVAKHRYRFYVCTFVAECAANPGRMGILGCEGEVEGVISRIFEIKAKMSTPSLEIEAGEAKMRARGDVAPVKIRTFVALACPK